MLVACVSKLPLTCLHKFLSVCANCVFEIMTDIKKIANEVVALLRSKGYTFASAESCTGGAIASAITSVAGCSDVMLGAVVAYHNSVKQGVLGVAAETLGIYGAVSECVVREMVQGVSQKLGATCAVATSGVAGPGGGTAEKPVGTVWVAVKVGEKLITRLLQLGDCGREKNIEKTVCEVLLMLKAELAV